MLDPEVYAEPSSAEHFRLPKRRIVSAAQPPASGHPVASSELDHVLPQHVRPRVKYARSHADFRNDELETAHVTRRRIPSPQPTVLAPLRAYPGQLVNFPPTKTTSLPRRKVPLRAPTRPSGSPSSSSSSAKHLPPSPPLPNSFADLLAAAAAVEKEDARGGGEVTTTTTTERACVCRQPPDAPCARDFVVPEPVPKAGSSDQDGSSSLSRLLGVGKDAKVIDLDQSPMFL